MRSLVLTGMASDRDCKRFIHPDDQNAFKLNKCNMGILGENKGKSGRYHLIAWRDQTFRVKKWLILKFIDWRPEWQFEFGQSYFVPEKDMMAKIEAMGWHHKQSEPYFFVSYNGKKNSRRYWAKDFQKSIE